MNNFNVSQPTHVQFEVGGLNNLGNIAKKYGKNCLLITATPIDALLPLYNRTQKLLEDAGLNVTMFSKVEPNPTTEIIDEAISLATSISADVVIALGGGSTIDTSKVVCFCKGQNSAPFEQLFETYTSPFESYPLPFGEKLPLIAIPTTSGTGSQCTQAAVITDTTTNLKTTIFSRDLYPTECIVDPELTMTLPYYMTACTGFDAFSHSFESFINGKLAPHVADCALRGMKLVIDNLPLLKDSNKIEYRYALSYADTLGGISLANGGAYAPHPLSEIISSYAKTVNHGQSLAMVYPSCIKHTVSAKTKEYAQIARLFDSNLNSKSDIECAEKLSTLVADFIDLIGLSNKVSITSEEKELIINCPILKFLPMASEQTLKDILNDSI